MPYQPHTPLAQRKVLVVDDDPFSLEVLTLQLRELGIRDITAVQDGASAVRTLEHARGSFDLLLTDLHMPNMDGFEFIGAATRAGFDGGLVIVSGQDGDVLHSAALVAQLRRIKLLGTVSKPVKRELLAKAIG